MQYAMPCMAKVYNMAYKAMIIFLVVLAKITWELELKDLKWYLNKKKPDMSLLVYMVGYILATKNGTVIYRCAEACISLSQCIWCQ